jgi:DNA polymerase-3 subunit chi
MRTDFYLLSSESLAERDHYACRLIEKAFLARHTLYIATDSDEEATRFDQLLWQFRAESFVPHALSKNHPADEAMPILIGTASSTQPAEIWLNLSVQPAPMAPPCQRLIEIVPNIPALQASARERFRHYRELGYTLQTHHI